MQAHAEAPLFSFSTKSLDYVIGTFRIPNYDVPDLPLNTVFSKAESLEVGETRATAESQISAGCRRVYNQSRYFAHNGDSIKTTQWRVGNTPYEPQTLKEQFNSGASACACIRGGFGTFAWTSVGR